MGDSRVHISQRAASFEESVIRDMTRQAHHYGAINLSQGFPDFAAPQELKEAARQAIADDFNQYPITWGQFAFLDAIAAKYQRVYGMDVDPETMVCVTCGATEAMIATMLGVLNPGDEVILFEPFYENYGPDAILAGATRTYVTLHAPDWTFDEAELRAAFTPKTRAIIINTPNNPTGKVFMWEELTLISDLCNEHDVMVFTDEIYEHITYDGAEHIPPATIPGLAERTVTISALSKTYAVTGWRVGWAIAPPELMAGIRSVHDFMTVGAATPLQEAGVTALNMPEEYYSNSANAYRERRDLLLQILEETGFHATPPKGAYYVMADISDLGFANDVAAAHHLVETVGVATVPGSSFFRHPELGRDLLRFAFCKKLETLEAAGDRLRAFAANR